MSEMEPERRGGTRIPYIDGIRGYLILSMTISHLTAVTGPNLFQHLTHKTFAAFFTGEGFMFVSGMMAGLVFTRSFVKSGMVQTIKMSSRKGLKIYKYYWVVFLLSGLSTMFVPEIENTELISYFKDIRPLSAESMAMFGVFLYRPSFFDILFLYVVLIPLSPLVIYALDRGRIFELTLGATLMWVLVQYGLIDKGLDKIGQQVGLSDLGQLSDFKLLGWQLVFVIGVVLGYAFCRTEDFAAKARAFVSGPAIKVAAAILTAFAVLGTASSLGLVQLNYTFAQDYFSADSLNLLNFASAAVVIFYLLASSPEGLSGIARFARRLLTAFLTLPFIEAIGRNTLQTFSASVVLTYWTHLILQQADAGGMLVNAVAVVVVAAAIYAVSLAQEARKQHRKRAGRPIAAKKA